MAGGAIVTSYIAPPIPDRRFDYCARLADADEHGPQGFGETEEAAVADLKEQLAEADADRQAEGLTP